MSEVEEWLNIIGLPELFVYFEEDGWVTLDGITLMTEHDIKNITPKRGHITIILEEIRRLKSSLIPANQEEQFALTPAPLDAEIIYNESEEFTARPSRASRRSETQVRSSSVPPKQTLDEMLAPYIYRKYGFMKKYGPASHGMSYLDQIDVNQERVDRGKFRDHYSNNYIWVEKNHVNDVGVRYDGISRKVDHKPSHWRCEDEIERGKEYKRMNDECGDKLSDNRSSIDNSREWLSNDGGVVERVHKLSAAHAKTRYDLNSIRRNMDNLKAMRTRLLQ